MKKISVIRHNVLGELKILLADQRCPNNNNIHQIKSHKLLNDTEKRDIFRWRPRVTIAREDRSMVREPRFRRRTTTREVETYYMRRDYEIVIGIFTSWLRLNFHLCFFFVFNNLQNFNTMKTELRRLYYNRFILTWHLCTSLQS